MGLLARLRRGLSRTTEHLARRFDEIVRRADAAAAADVDAETIDALEELLISADVGVAATARILAGVQGHRRDGVGLGALVKREILSIFSELDTQPRSGLTGRSAGVQARDGGSRGSVQRSEPASKPADPRVVLIVGVNGTGKTTTVGKLAYVERTARRWPLVCAADTFRAAAVEQLAVWAARAGVEIVRAREGADPAAVVFDSIQAARARGCDSVIVDTAGRLHTRANLMSELEKIRRVAAREVQGAPHDVLLVLDATVGQNGLVQAREFLTKAAVTGIVLAKLDGTARGGIGVAIAQDLRLPIRYVGVGEAIDDLLPFSPEEYVDALFEPGR